MMSRDLEQCFESNTTAEAICNTVPVNVTDTWHTGSAILHYNFQTQADIQPFQSTVDYCQVPMIYTVDYGCSLVICST